MEPKDYERLVEPLRSDDWKTRHEAAKGLVRELGVKAVDVLVDVLKDESPYARWIAAEFLGEIGDKRAIGPLTVALKDTYSQEIRVAEWDEIEAGTWHVEGYRFPVRNAAELALKKIKARVPRGTKKE